MERLKRHFGRRSQKNHDLFDSNRKPFFAVFTDRHSNFKNSTQAILYYQAFTLPKRKKPFVQKKAIIPLRNRYTFFRKQIYFQKKQVVGENTYFIDLQYS